MNDSSFQLKNQNILLIEIDNFLKKLIYMLSCLFVEKPGENNFENNVM